MKFTIDRSSFLKVLTTVNVAIGPKSPSPAFLNFNLKMSDDGLTVLGSDGDFIIESFLPRVVDDKELITDYIEGGALVSAKYLLDIVRSLSGQTVTVDIYDEVIARIYDKNSDFKLNAMNIQEYPDLDTNIEGQSVVFASSDFKKIISQTAFAASNKEVRPILTAVNFKSENGNAEFVATDSYRLSKKSVTLTDNMNKIDANIPVKALNEVSKLLEGEEVELTISVNKASFKFGNTKVITKLINGEFPKTSRMIPTQYPYVVKINANNLISAMQRVSVLSVEREKVVRLTLQRDLVEVSSRSESVGSAKDSVELFEYDGDRFVISFNVDYVIDALRATLSEDVVLSFAGEMNAFKVTSPEDESIIQIITPVRSYY